MTTPVSITTPLKESDILSLRTGDRVLLQGVIYTARDAAHKRLIELLREGKELPLELEGQVIYYTGPAPARPGEVIGAAGPTTAYRMDPFTPPLLEAGLRGMIGKGDRGKDVIEAIKQNIAVYFAATGGAALLYSHAIKKATVAAYPELGPEAILRLEVEDFPVIVAIDSSGDNIYREVILHKVANEVS
ncbi:MAG: Fe-S-containing hydro-lyase [Candidatus Auribacterota bacterium]|nr:Fe-S-containing hydro-lyase [Candidatus Auribacterota bacterium]